jgi:acetylornithine deacetylase/succinyl-diaminopimelate desuccinylase-like protein
MHDDIRQAVADDFPHMKKTLADLVRIPSVSAASYPAAEVRHSAEAVARLLEEAGAAHVQILELEGAHPAVYGEVGGPPDTPTVLLYAHHDVQPPGPADEWRTGPFEPSERDGRLYGRGSSDDKSGVIMHLGMLRAFGGKPPVGVKFFFEGEEEVGSSHLEDFLHKYSDQIRSDVIVIADAGTWRVGAPAITTSLRGITACVVEVRTLNSAVHSGQFGGAFPDAITTLCHLLASLHDEGGNVAVPGLVAYESDPLDLTEDEVRQQAGTVAGLKSIGDGGWTSRMWSKPAISVLAIDAPRISEAINQLVPVAAAKVSMRLAPGQDGKAAEDALRRHLEANVPWGAELTVRSDGFGDAFALATDAPAFAAFREAMEAVWGTPPVEMGSGGSIPFVAAFSAQMPDAPVILIGAGDPTSAFHGPNESQHLGDLEKSIVAEAVALRLLAG